MKSRFFGGLRPRFSSLLSETQASVTNLESLVSMVQEAEAAESWSATRNKWGFDEDKFHDKKKYGMTLNLMKNVNHDTSEKLGFGAADMRTS